jgi:hypothetical protein
MAGLGPAVTPAVSQLLTVIAPPRGTPPPCGWSAVPRGAHQRLAGEVAAGDVADDGRRRERDARADAKGDAPRAQAEHRAGRQPAIHAVPGVVLACAINRRGLVLCSIHAPRRARPPAEHAVQATSPAARSAAWWLRGYGYGHANAFTVSQKPYNAFQAPGASADSPVLVQGLHSSQTRSLQDVLLAPCPAARCACIWQGCALLAATAATPTTAPHPQNLRISGHAVRLATDSSGHGCPEQRAHGAGLPPSSPWP